MIETKYFCIINDNAGIAILQVNLDKEPFYTFVILDTGVGAHGAVGGVTEGGVAEGGSGAQHSSES